MKFTVEHRNPGRVRIRLAGGGLTPEESRAVRLALLRIPEVLDVRIYRATGGAGIFYSGEEAALLEHIREAEASPDPAAYPDTEPESPFLNAEEIRRRGLDPHFKRKMRRHILAEAFFDVVMPMPVQLAYHAGQLIRLEKM